jgi:FtsP/CotA-like multicopper oxidase with cupredoxin domain
MMSRRAFLSSATVAATGLAVSFRHRNVFGAMETLYVPRPSKPQYVLRVAPTTLNPDGKQNVAAVTANGIFPGPEIRVREGHQLRIRVENLLNQPTSIHWHGLLVPASMDGVPDVSNDPIAAGRVFVYEFPIRQTGTYWYHSHWDMQEQIGLAGPFVIEEADGPGNIDHDAVVMISDWLYRSPEQVWATLRQKTSTRAGSTMQGGMPMGTMQPKGEMPMKGGTPGIAMSMKEQKKAAGGTAVTIGASSGVDLSDVTYDAFLINGKGSANPWILKARPGERIRLRFINAGASTYFRLRLDRIPLRITHADGIAVRPVTVDHLLIGMAECYDAVVSLPASGSYTIHAVAQDGSGQAVGVLHTPDVLPVPNLTMPAFDGRALSYTDLHAVAPTTLPNGPTRSFRLALQGDMSRYIWTIDGQAYPKADPLLIRQGDRVEVEMKNETMMWHPMHLHGHFFRVLQGAGELSPLKHTVNVAPRETVKFEFTADNPGQWIFHCHNLYHLEAGMARVFEYQA